MNAVRSTGVCTWVLSRKQNNRTKTLVNVNKQEGRSQANYWNYDEKQNAVSFSNTQKMRMCVCAEGWGEEWECVEYFRLSNAMCNRCCWFTFSGSQAKVCVVYCELFDGVSFLFGSHFSTENPSYSMRTKFDVVDVRSVHISRRRMILNANYLHMSPRTVFILMQWMKLTVFHLCESQRFHR